MNQEKTFCPFTKLPFSPKTEIDEQDTDDNNQGAAQNMSSVRRDIKITPERNIPGCHNDEQAADNRDESLKIAHKTLPTELLHIDDITIIFYQKRTV